MGTGASMRRGILILGRMLAVSALLGFGVTVPGTPASAYDGYHQIISRAGVCLEVDHARARDGDPVTVDWCSYRGTNQFWILEPVPDAPEWYQIRVQHTGKCLDVRAISYNDGAQIHQWTCVGGQNQQWQLSGAGGGYHNIVARHSKKCLDKAGWNVVQWNCHDVHWQRWRLS